jgi:hypothetical protein
VDGALSVWQQAIGVGTVAETGSVESTDVKVKGIAATCMILNGKTQEMARRDQVKTIVVIQLKRETYRRVQT